VGWAANGKKKRKKQKALRAPTPAGGVFTRVYGGECKITPSFLIEIFIGFFLIAKFHSHFEPRTKEPSAVDPPASTKP
jgi:hypothetical protein